MPASIPIMRDRYLILALFKGFDTFVAIVGSVAHTRNPVAC